ncbi:hypothetical protein [Pseudomonas reidholzensis]|nr:hypothetical protein [Pseudomonas reidholzensis]
MGDPRHQVKGSALAGASLYSNRWLEYFFASDPGNDADTANWMMALG